MQNGKLTTVLEAIKDIKLALRTYCLCPDKLPVSIADLRYALEHARDIKINRLFFRSDSKILKGLFRHFGDRVEILIRSDLDDYTARFVFAKEVGHVVLMDAENVTQDPDLFLEKLLMDQKIVGAIDATPDVQAESLAFMVAIELLFPYEDRKYDKAKLAKAET